MQQLDLFRDGGTGLALAGAIAAEACRDRSYRFMEFCGSHTHAIARHGLAALLPPPVRLIHGPG